VQSIKGMRINKADKEFLLRQVSASLSFFEPLKEAWTTDHGKWPGQEDNEAAGE
jgi:hypothetical protein